MEEMQGGRQEGEGQRTKEKEIERRGKERERKKKEGRRKDIKGGTENRVQKKINKKIRREMCSLRDKTLI